MTIYIEYVIIDNLIIDSLILLSCKKIASISTTKLRIFLSALTGTIVAVLSPFMPQIINLIIKPFVAILMTFIAFKPASLKKLLALTLILFLVTFLYGGAMIGLMEMLNIQFTLANGISYVNNFPVGIAILLCAITYILVKNIIIFCTKKQHSNFLYPVVLIDGNKQISTTAFLDSGNCILVKNKPVTLINFKTFNMLYPAISLTDLLLKKDLPLKQQNYAQINGLSNMTEKILVFEIDALKINGKETKDALLGLSLKNFNDKTNSDAIISNMILGD
ncbi:MAG: sigma-E processing peptidase SpoIIGA [Christensenellales bacterium]